ncbi:MAG: SAM-dependent methyltransferase [Acidobacteria bacterium]|nr:MAG: SAM-dependent methyltransferase [Acidobacteriota bacterium]
MLVNEAYKNWSATYDSDRNLTRDLDQQVTRRTFETQRFKSILEIGCGTGKNTAFLASIANKMLALDFSEQMIEKAKHKSSTDNVTFRVADITDPWLVADRSIDLVTCNLVLEHVEDLGFVFGEAARVLIEGGNLFVSELHPFRQYQGVVARFERNNERIEIPAFVHHISDFLNAAAGNNLALSSMKEMWHAEDENKPPRLISFLFGKLGN